MAMVRRETPQDGAVFIVVAAVIRARVADQPHQLVAPLPICDLVVVDAVKVTGPDGKTRGDRRNVVVIRKHWSLLLFVFDHDVWKRWRQLVDVADVAAGDDDDIWGFVEQ